MHSSCHYLTRIVCPNFVWYVMSLGSTTSTSSPYIYIHSTFSEGERHQNNLTIETWLKLVAQILNILDHLLWCLQLQSISTQHMTTFNHRRHAGQRAWQLLTKCQHFGRFQNVLILITGYKEFALCSTDEVPRWCEWSSDRSNKIENPNYQNIEDLYPWMVSWRWFHLVCNVHFVVWIN